VTFGHRTGCLVRTGADLAVAAAPGLPLSGPRVGPRHRFHAEPAKQVAELRKALALGLSARPVLVGPVTYLLLAKPAPGVPTDFDPLALLDRLLPVYAEVLADLRAAGAEWVQFDEPAVAPSAAPRRRRSRRIAGTRSSTASPGHVVRRRSDRAVPVQQSEDPPAEFRRAGMAHVTRRRAAAQRRRPRCPNRRRRPRERASARWRELRRPGHRTAPGLAGLDEPRRRTALTRGRVATGRGDFVEHRPRLPGRSRPDAHTA
jgi:hypothetical protein